MDHKTHKNLLKAKFSTLKLILMIGIGCFFLLFNYCLADSLFDDDFETYNVGFLCEVGDWTCSKIADQNYSITTTQAYSGDKSVSRFNAGIYYLTRIGEDLEDTGIISFWIYTSSDFATSSVNHSDFRTEIDGDYWINFRLIAPTSTIGEATIQGYSTEMGFEDLEILEKDKWTFLEMGWDRINQKVKYRIDFGDWTIRDSSITATTSLKSFFWVNSFYYLAGDIYLDKIVSQGSGAIGTCGAGSYCYFCYSEVDCEDQGCIWLEIPFGDDVCVESEAPLEAETSTIFTTYYSENSDFATPTAFISRLAFTTQPFLFLMSSWISNFSGYFDLEVAQENGENLGQAIPKARGYLTFFDALFHDLPLSEILIVYLIVLLGVIIFRIIRQIKKLLIV